MKLSRRRTNYLKYRNNGTNQLPVRWLKWDIIIGNTILVLLGILVGYFIHAQQIETNTKIAETAQEMENLRTELSNKIIQGQLASSIIEPLLKGSESERLTAMFILENSASDEFSETILAAIAIWDKDKQVRTEAIRILEKKGKSLFTQQALSRIKEAGLTKEEREAAIQAHNKVKNRLKETLNYRLALARTYYENGLYQSAANEFKEVEDLLVDSNIDQGELELAKVNYKLKDFKSSAEHYIKATEKIL